MTEEVKNVRTKTKSTVSSPIEETTEKEVLPTRKVNKTLTIQETQEIEKVFKDAKDFRTIWERITSPIDKIIEKTADIIDKDPIMNVSDELSKMNSGVQEVYKEIIDNDGAIMKTLKKIPLIGGIAKSVDEKLDEAKFNLKGLNGKIETIFSGFDQSYSSINTSIDMQRNFLDGVDNNLDKIILYKEFIELKIEEFQERMENSADEVEREKLQLFINNVEFFRNNLIVLIGNLEMARKRLLLRLDSAEKLSLAMNSSRPIFKTLLSSAIIETSSQKAIDASINAITAMSQTIDNMSTVLTDKAIESSRKSEEIARKPVLSTAVFMENVTKLKNHFDEIETYREQIRLESKREMEEIEKGRENLRNIKTLGASEHLELQAEILAK